MLEVHFIWLYLLQIYISGYHEQYNWLNYINSTFLLRNSYFTNSSLKNIFDHCGYYAFCTKYAENFENFFWRKKHGSFQPRNNTLAHFFPSIFIFFCVLRFSGKRVQRDMIKLHYWNISSRNPSHFLSLEFLWNFDWKS